MKKNYIIGGILLILIVLGFTNPSEKDHKNAVTKKFVDSIKSSPTSNKWEEAGQNLGIMLAEKMIDGMVERNNFIIFSTTKATFGGETKTIGFGILGNVYIKEIPKN